MLTRVRAITAVIAATCFFATAPMALADSGGLDTAFGVNGIEELTGALGNSTLTNSIVLADGSIVAVGQGVPGLNNDVIVAKFTPDGAPDGSYGTNGVAWFDVGGADDIAYAVAERSGGGLWIGGQYVNTTGPQNEGFVAALDANGNLDAGFGVGGLTTIPIADTQIRTVADAGGGSVFFGLWDPASGVFGESQIGRLDSSGAADPGFNGGGTFPYGNQGDTSNIPIGLHVQSDSQVIAITNAVNADGTSTIRLIRLDATGAPDPGYGVFGELAAPLPGAVNTASRTSIDGSDNIRILGARAALAGGTTQGVASQLDNTGMLDATFGSGGQITFPAASSDWTISGMTAVPGGGWYFAGNFGATQVRTAKTANDGTIDVTWGTSGFSARTFDASPSRALDMMVAPASERPLIVGQNGTVGAMFGLERFNYANTQATTITATPSFLTRFTSTAFAFKVKNNGPDATSVTTNVTFPASLTNRSFSSTNSGTTLAIAGGVAWTVPSLASGATATLTLTATPSAEGPITLTSRVNSQSAQRVGAAAVTKTFTSTVYGSATPFSDRILGTPQRDVIDALAGDDVVFAKGGNDSIKGNAGNDKLYGEAGNDRLNGGPGNDRLYGGAGDDYLIALFGNDVLFGGPGRDRLDGHGLNDNINGGDGDDYINTKGGNDVARGNAGSDWLNGAAGNDRLFGGDNGDLITGGAGADRLYGGTGFDIIRADDNAGGDMIDCGTGWDLVYANPGDSVAGNCEFVKFDVPGGTPN